MRGGGLSIPNGIYIFPFHRRGRRARSCPTPRSNRSVFQCQRSPSCYCHCCSCSAARIENPSSGSIWASIWNPFRTLFGSHLEFISDPFWLPFGINFEPVLASIWNPFRANSVPILGPFGTSFGPIWGPLRAHLAPIWDQFRAHFGSHLGSISDPFQNKFPATSSLHTAKPLAALQPPPQSPLMPTCPSWDKGGIYSR